MKRTHLATAVSLLLAAVIVCLGVIAVDVAERWLFPAPQPAYIPAGDTQATVLRFESGEELRLYPMNEYDPKNCIPAESSDIFDAGYRTHYLNWNGVEAPEEISTTDRHYVIYKTYIDRLVSAAVGEFVRAEKEGLYLLKFDLYQYIVNHMEYDPRSDLFYVHDFHVGMHFSSQSNTSSGYDHTGNMTLAFRSDLLTECELVYFRFTTETPVSSGWKTESVNNWLLDNYTDYRAGDTQPDRTLHPTNGEKCRLVG